MSIGIPEETPPRRIESPAEHARILVVDEDPAFQLGLKTFLREYVGFEKVYTALSGAEAMERILDDETIDVVTLDYRMPGMNGIEVLESLRETLDRPVSFLMITGYPSEELEEQFQSLRAPHILPSFFLAKPIDFEKLEPLILRAHQEVNAARNVGVAGIEGQSPAAMEENNPDGGGENVSDPGREIRELREQVVLQGDRLEKIEAQVAEMRGNRRRDLFKLVLLVGIVFSASHFNWIEKAKPAWDRFVEDVRVYLPQPESANPAPPGGSGENLSPTTPDRTGETSGNPTAPPPSLNEGRPL